MGMVYKLFHSKTAGALATWLTLSASFFAWVGSMTPQWFGELTWPQLLLVGLCGALVATLVLAWALAGLAHAYRHAWPLPASGSSESQSAPPPGSAVAYDDSELRAAILEIKAAQSRLADEVRQEVNQRLEPILASVNRLELYAQRSRLTAARETLTRAEARISELLGKHREEYAKPASHRVRNEGHHSLPRALHGFQRSLTETLGLDIDLTQHPNYTLNPLRTVDGDAEVESDSDRQDFRRTYDQGKTALTTIRKEGAAIDRKILGLETVLRRLEGPVSSIPERRT